MKDKKWLEEKKFMKGIPLLTVSEFLFKHSQNKVICRIFDEEFTNFLTEHLFEASKKINPSTDLLMSLLEIGSITEYMQEHFIEWARSEDAVLTMDAYDALYCCILGEVTYES